MKRHWCIRGVKCAVFAAVFLAAFGFVVQRLWNWLAPPLFGGHGIGYWQALGLLLLCKILFGGFRGHCGPPGHWRRHMIERWENMTPEEREKFRHGLSGCCGRGETPAAEQ